VLRVTTLLLTFVGPMISTGWAPLATTLYVQNDLARFDELSRRITKIIILFTGPFFILLAGAPDTTMSVLLGERFASSATIVEILLAGFAVNLLFAQNGTALIASGARKQAAVIYGGGALVMTLLAVILIPPFGAEGAAVTTAIATVMLNVLVAFSLNRRIGVHPIHRDILIVFVTMAIPAALLRLVSANASSTVAQFAAAVGLSLAWWAAMFATRVVTLSELRSFVPKRRPRSSDGTTA
jgi:O-antigen/teichoic acid export membrane protein